MKSSRMKKKKKKKKKKDLGKAGALLTIFQAKLILLKLVFELKTLSKQLQPA